MIDPVDVQRFAIAALSAGAVVLFGACYAVFLALSRLRGFILLYHLSNLSYVAVAASVAVLGWSLRLGGAWLVLEALLLLDLIALAGLYLAGMFYTTNLSVDQY